MMGSLARYFEEGKRVQGIVVYDFKTKNKKHVHYLAFRKFLQNSLKFHFVGFPLEGEKKEKGQLTAQEESETLGKKCVCVSGRSTAFEKIIQISRLNCPYHPHVHTCIRKFDVHMRDPI